jgi:hypothetical protein
MTPGEPPAQLDDPLADLVVDVPQVRGELVAPRRAERYLWVPQAGLLGLTGLVPQLCRGPVNQVLVGTHSDPAGALSVGDG